MEAEIIQKMSIFEGYSKLYYSGVYDGMTYIVQDILGLSLENLK